MKKGFTLIELAIVLIIIGIVIGAIISARDLIESAKLNGIISDFKKYESAFNAFKEKYGAIPGDMPDAESVFTVPDTGCPGYYNGNGDNIIVRNSNYEELTAMDMLSKAGFIDFKANQLYLSCDGITQNLDKSIGTRLPESTLKNSGFVMMKVSLTSADVVLASDSTDINYYPVPFGSSLTSREAFNLDKKTDDGLPNSGLFRAYRGMEYGEEGPMECTTDSLDAYDLEEPKDQKSCVPSLVLEN